MTVPQRSVFLCTAVKLQSWPMLVTYWTQHTWRMLASTFPNQSFIWAINFSGSTEVLWLENKPLGWPWANLGCCLRNHRKTLMSTKASFCGKAFLINLQKIAFGENKDVNSSIKFIQQFFCASLGRSLCHGNEHQGIDPNILSSGHHDCSTKAVFSLHSCQTAILPHVGTLNSAYCAFSTFQSAFIWAIIALAVLWSSFQLKITLGLALGESWPFALRNHKKHWCLQRPAFRGNSFPVGKPACIAFMTDEITNANSWIKFRLYNKSSAQPWEELLPWERTPGHWSKHP